MVGQKFAVLLCADDSDYLKKNHGGYFGVFVRMLKEEGDDWDVFYIYGGEGRVSGGRRDRKLRRIRHHRKL
ncbi:hypothetical protein CASFOL_038878 [Castilleja foliolosa]|uniref:Uncharacterized protein n=1 Tax=Castilleja foliolosa TaxID=1961234 RepID=A0ABD3BIQ6_9LAMI